MRTIRDYLLNTQVPSGSVALMVINPRKVGAMLTAKYTVTDDAGKEKIHTWGKPTIRGARSGGVTNQVEVYEPIKLEQHIMQFDKQAQKAFIEFLTNYPECGNSPSWKRANGDDVESALFIMVDPEVAAKERLMSSSTSHVRMRLLFDKVGTVTEEGKVVWVKGGKDLALKIILNIVQAADFANIPADSLSDAMIYDRIFNLVMSDTEGVRVSDILRSQTKSIDLTVEVNNAITAGIIQEANGMLMYREIPIGTLASVIKSIQNLDAPSNAGFKGYWDSIQLELEALKK